MQLNVKPIAWVAVAGFLLLAALFLPSPLPGRVGAGDFTAYWTASYLLAHGENFSDPARLYQIERELTGWRESWPFITWNPPWLLALLLPYTWVPFDRAAWLWMLTSVALILASALVLWRLDAVRPTTKRRAYWSLFLALVFPPSLLALTAGQVDVLVLAGLAGFLFFDAKGEFGRAGMVLALTMVKPHLVYVTLVILLLDYARRRRWHGLVGFTMVLVVLAALVFLLRPTFLLEYSIATGGAGLLDWQTPTLGGILDAAWGWHWSKLMCLVVLPLSVGAWRRGRDVWATRTVVDVTILISLISAPFGWSYDFILLLLPLLRLVTWILDREFVSSNSLLLGLGLGFLTAAMYYQRTVMSNEVEFFWVPVAVGGMYFFALLRLKSGYRTVRTPVLEAH